MNAHLGTIENNKLLLTHIPVMDRSPEIKPMDWKSVKIQETPQALYLRLAEAVRNLVKMGTLAPGDWLPSSRQLSEDLKIHRHTITTSLDELVAEGWLIVVERKGYQVNSNLPTSKPQKKSKPAHFKFKRIVELGSFSPKVPIKHNFQSGIPDLRLFPINEYKSALNEALRDEEHALLDYGSPLGIEPLRNELKKYIELMRGIRDREVIITCGSQEAVYITSQLLLDKDCAVAIDELSYPPAREAFMLANAKVAPIAMDQDGMIPDELLKAIKRQDIRMLFLTPTHQFPTTINMPATRRLEILSIANQHGIVVVEDDYDHEFHYTSTPPHAMSSIDTTGRMLYISTFSKLLFPSVRLGFMAVPEEFAAQFAQFRRITTHQNDAMSQMALANWIRNKGIFRHFKKMKTAYEARLKAMDTALLELRDKGLNLSWNIPEGGMALWLNIHKNADLVAAKALDKGIFVTPESYYRTKKGPNHHLRLGFSNQNEEEIAFGIKALGKILSQT